MPEREREIAHPLMAKCAASRGAALIIAVGALFSESALAQLADSSWPIFRHDAQFTARAQTNGPTIPAVKWIARFGNGRLGAPAIGPDGTIYVPGVVDSALYAVAPDGKLRWIFAGTRREEFASSPVVDQNGTIYFGSSKHIFYAVNPNGTERWRLTLGGEVRVSANIGRDGTIYVTAWDNKLYAMTPEGKIKWSVDLKGRRSRNGPAIASDGTIYVIADEFLMAFNEDGKFQFEHDCRDISVLSGLMVEGNETVYVTALTTAKIKAISTGNVERWKKFFPNDFGPATMPALGSDGAIYYASVKEGGIFALNHDGSTRWTFTLPGTENLTELALDAANNVYIVNDSLGLISLGGADGKLRWSLSEVHCAYSPAFGADGTIYIASDKKLYAVGPQTPFAASLINVSGDSQSACIETPLLPLPIKAKVLDQYGNPFPNQPVRFRVISGGGSPRDTTVFTDGNGFAQVFWKLGSLVGKQEMEVSSKDSTGKHLAGSPIIFTATLKAPKISGPPIVLFDPTEIKHASDTTYVVCNKSECVLRIDSVKVLLDDSGFFVFPTGFPAVTPLLVPPGECLSLRLQFAPRDCGTHTTTLCIYSNDPVQPEFCVPLRGSALQQPDIEVAKKLIDFGTICRDTAITDTFFNFGCADLTIKNLVFSNPAFSTDRATPFTIAPGASATISIRFIPVAGRPDADTLSIFSNDPDENLITVPIGGSGGEADIDGKKEVVFDTVDVQICAGLNNADTATYVIHNVGSCALNIDTLFVDLPEFSVIPPNRHLIIPPRDSLPVKIKFEPKAKGDYVGTLAIVSDDSDEHEFRVALHGVGREAPDIDVTPLVLDFREVPAGTDKRLPITIKNVGALRLSVDSLVIKSKIFSTEKLEFSLDCNQSRSVDVAFMPPDSGVFVDTTYVDTLFIYSNDPDENPFKVVLRGMGTVPDIAFASDTLDFGAVSDTTDSVFFVQNVGKAPLVVNSISLSNPLAFRITVAPKQTPIRKNSIRESISSAARLTQEELFVVAPGDSKKVTVTFFPTPGRQDTGRVSISSNDPDENPAILHLRGKGAEPKIAVMPNPLDFGAVCGGRDSLSFVTVKNEGDDTLQVDSLKFSNPAFSTTHPTPFNVPPGGSEKIFVRFVAVVGKKDTCTLSIFSNDPSENPFKVGLRGEGASPEIVIEAKPEDFGEVCIGSTVATVFTIFNPSKTCTLIVDSVKFTTVFPPNCNATPTAQFSLNRTILNPIPPIPPGGRYPLPPQGVDDPPCDFKIRVRVWAKAPNANPIVKEVSGRVIPPAIAGDEKVDFGKVLVNTWKQDTARVWNADKCDVRIDSLRIKGGKDSAFSLGVFSLPKTLNPGGATGIPVIFSPDSVGQYTDTLFVFNNDPKRNPLPIVLFGTGTDTTGPCDEPPQIAVNPDSLPFGDVPVGNTVFKNLTIRNTGCDTLRVTDVRNNLPAIFYVNAADKKFNLAPDSQRVVPVFFAPAAQESYFDTLRIVNNDASKGTVLVPLNGRGVGGPGLKPDISVTPGALDFGIVCGPVDLVIVVSNEGEADLQVDSLRFSNQAFSTGHADSFMVPPGHSEKITVHFIPGSDTTGTLSIFSNDPDENPFVVNLHGKGGVGDIDGLAEVKFDTVEIQTCANRDNFDEQTYLIYNKGVCDLVVDSLDTFLPFSLITPSARYVIHAGGSLEIKLKFTPIASGDISAVLRIFSDDPDERPFLVTLRGYGLAAPDIDVNPLVLDFGDVPVGGIKRLDGLKIKNDGKLTLTVNSFVSSCPQFTTEIGEFARECGEDSSVTVVFKPTALGPIECTLSIFSNDPNENPVVVILRGNGIGPKLAVAPDTLDFGVVCGPVDSVITITNRGPVSAQIDLLNFSNPAFSTTQTVPFIVAANSSKRINVHFNPTPGHDDIGTLSIVSNTPPATTLKVSLTGKGGVPDIAIAPVTLDFGVVCQESVLYKVVENAGRCSLRVDSLLFSNPVFSTNHPLPFTVIPGATDTIWIRYTPVAGRADTCTVSIFSNDPDENPFVVNLRGKGGVPDIDGAPEVKFDTVSVACGGPANSTTQNYVIRNLGSCDLLIDTLTVTGDFSIISGGGAQTIAPNGSASVVLQFTPQTPVAHVGMLKIFSDDPDESPFKVVLRGVGMAAPTVDVDPDTLDFGDVPVNSRKRLTIKIMSQGAITLRVDSLVSSCPPVFTTEADEFQLACGEDSSVTVAFSPTVPGLFVCKLSIYSNDPKKNPAEVVLRGNAVTGILAVCETIDYGNTCAGKPVTKECLLINKSKIAAVIIDSLKLVLRKDYSFSFTAPDTLEPEESRLLKITFDPKKDGAERDASDKLLIYTKWSGQDTIKLLGYKKSDWPKLILLPPDSIKFVGVLGEETECRPVVIFNDGCSTLVVNDLKVLELTNDLKWIEPANVFELCDRNATPFRLEPGETKDVKVLFRGIDLGEKQGELRIFNDDPVANPTVVELKGLIPPGGVCSEIDSTQIRFGKVFLNQPKTVTISVSNCNEPSAPALLQVQAEVLTLKDEYTVAPAVVPNLTTGANALLNITFKPKVTGERNDTLKLLITTVLGNKADTTIRIPLSGIGISDEVYALPNAFTPNDDDKNDFAKIHFPGYKMVSPVLRIYDLRGIAVRVLRRQNDRGDIIAWDGYDNEGHGRLMPPGAYLWLLDDQGKKVGSGVIVLIR